MLMFTIICAVLIILPFAMGYIHLKISLRNDSTIIYYRYFMIMNMVFAGLFVALRMLFFGHLAAGVTGWAYSPIFQLYAAAILTMVLMGFLTLFSRSKLMLAPAICWSIFSLLSAILHGIQLVDHDVTDASIVLVHVFYDIIVSLIILRFMYSLNDFFLDLGAHHYDST